MIRVIAFVAALLAALLVVWAIGSHAFRPARVEAPPYADAVKHFPDRDENDSAQRFFSAIARLDEAKLRQQREMEVAYVREQVASPLAATDPPPAALATFLRQNAATIHTMRADLVSNPVPVWKQRADDLLDTPQPNYTLLNQTMLMFAADALAEHNALNDAAAWSDLGAIWVLARSVWVRPEITSIAVALNGSRFIAAIATKLAPPPPKWWSEFLAVNPRTALVHALEYEAWATRARAERYPAGEPDDDRPLADAIRRTVGPLLWPVQIYSANQRVHAIRESIRAIAVAEPCRPIESQPLRPWSWALHRVDRFLVERDGVTKLLAAEEERVTSGAWPAQIDVQSVCRGAQWSYKRNGDAIEIRFTGHLATPQSGFVPSLTYRR